MKIDQNSIRGPYKLRTHAAIMAGQYHSRGFTLIELMIVIVIIGVIAAIALPAYANYVARAQVNRTFIEISAYRTAVEISLANGDSAALGVNAKEEVGFQDSSINSVTFGSFADAANSTIVATLGGTASASIHGSTVTLSRDLSGNWTCVVVGAGGGWSDKFKPKSCN